ncbi:MAG: phage shock protein A, partial [Myxococcota bacterium]
RMEEKVEQQEAEAEAAVELSGDVEGDTLANEFKELEGSGLGQSDALAALKAKMGVAPAAAKAAPATVAVTDSVEAELEALLNEDL